MRCGGLGRQRHATLIGKGEGLLAVKHDGGQRAAVSGAAVDVDAVAVMRGVVKRCVAVDDKETVVARVFEKARAYPDKIGFALAVHGDAGADARVDKDHLTALQPCRAVFEKGAVGMGDGGDGFGMDGGCGSVGGVFHPV